MKALIAALALSLSFDCMAQLRAAAPAQASYVLVFIVETEEAFHHDIVGVLPSADLCEQARVIAAKNAQARKPKEVMGFALACVRVIQQAAQN